MMDMPTSGDYAWAAAQSADKRSKGEAVKRLGLEEHIVVLQGQVSFLAGFVYDLLNGDVSVTQGDLSMINKIKEFGEE